MKFLSTLLLISTFGGHAKEQNCGPSRSTYLGCYENRNQDRALPYEMKERDYTPKECEMACASRGYLYFAREWMGQVREREEFIYMLCFKSVHICIVFVFCLSYISPLFTHIYLFLSIFYFLLCIIVFLFQLKRLQ